MLYVWQMNDGRWHVSAYTNAPRFAHRVAWDIPGSETRAEAEQRKRDAMTVIQHPAFETELTDAGEQTVIPGCERNASPKAKQLDLFG